MDEVFKALADAGRRRLLDSLNTRNGQTLRELCGELEMARQSVSKHLAVLEAANLVNTVWRGREKLHYLNAAPINAISERWIDQYDRERVRVVAETAQHAGHCDIIREMIDGGTATDREAAGDTAWWDRHLKRVRQAAERHRPTAHEPS